MLARELLNRPCSPSRAVAAGDDLVGDLLQAADAQVAAVFDDQLEAAGRAQAVDRRRPEGRDDRPLHLAAAAIQQRRRDGVGGQRSRRGAGESRRA